MKPSQGFTPFKGGISRHSSLVTAFMTPERWKQIEKLYHAALALGESQRSVFLDQACHGDEALRQELETLLALGLSAESSIEAPAIEGTVQGIVEGRARSMVGRQMGGYQILSLLGAGGMGEVYKAKDTRLDRKSTRLNSSHSRASRMPSSA